MNEDRIEGTGRKAAGKAEEAIGKLAANDRLETRGTVNQALGTVQDGYGRARDAVRGLLDGAPAAARDAVATGRDYYRRGTAAVTTRATDNTALTLLAAGVAVAAVSWLVFGRRRGKDEA
jgi:uncharacterized protein YjbJ (UPF0337 family)